MIEYVRARVCERSFWSDVIAGVAAAALLPWPWNAVVAAGSALKSLIPDRKASQ